MNIDPTIAIWQKSNHSIGMVDFLPCEKVVTTFAHNISSHYAPIGMCEAEALVVNIESGEIELLEHEVAGKVCCKAAKDQRHFIDSMTRLKTHFDKCVADNEYYENLESAVQVRTECSLLAGGKNYESFFCSLIGA